jgi:hypothetical protein
LPMDGSCPMTCRRRADYSLLRSWDGTLKTLCIAVHEQEGRNLIAAFHQAEALVVAGCE